MTKVSFATHPYLDQSKLPDNIDSIPYRSVETLKEANQLHKMVEYFHGIASKGRFYEAEGRHSLLGIQGPPFGQFGPYQKR